MTQLSFVAETVDGQWRGLHWTLCSKGYQEGKVSRSDCDFAANVLQFTGWLLLFPS